MNNALTNQIIYHILNNLGVTSNTKFSIKRDCFLLPSRLEIVDDGEMSLFPLYGCEVDINNSKFLMLLADFDTEFALVTKLENCPSYGCYLSVLDDQPSDGLISFSLHDNNWLISNMSIQANFLSGMENLGDVVNVWQLLDSKRREPLIKELSSFIEYYDSIVNRI